MQGAYTGKAKAVKLCFLNASSRKKRDQKAKGLKARAENGPDTPAEEAKGKGEDDPNTGAVGSAEKKRNMMASEAGSLFPHPGEQARVAKRLWPQPKRRQRTPASIRYSRRGNPVFTRLRRHAPKKCC
jgi:hypothetical protein